MTNNMTKVANHFDSFYPDVFNCLLTHVDQNSLNKLSSCNSKFYDVVAIHRKKLKVSTKSFRSLKNYDRLSKKVPEIIFTNEDCEYLFFSPHTKKLTFNCCMGIINIPKMICTIPFLVKLHIIDTSIGEELNLSYFPLLSDLKLKYEFLTHEPRTITNFINSSIKTLYIHDPNNSYPINILTIPSLQYVSIKAAINPSHGHHFTIPSQLTDCNIYNFQGKIKSLGFGNNMNLKNLHIFCHGIDFAKQLKRECKKRSVSCKIGAYDSIKHRIVSKI